MDGPIFRFLGWEDKTMELNNLNLKRFSLLLLIPVLIQAKGEFRLSLS